MSEWKNAAEEQSLVKRALQAVTAMQAKVELLEWAQVEPIAIIGMACRFPGGANDPQTYWHLLSEGRDAISRVPVERWDSEAFYDPNPDVPGKIYTHWGGFLEQVDHFDPHFFGISPREAESMDPQQRLVLEVAWEALENSGQVPTRLAGSRTGVFIGVSNNDYLWREVADPVRISTYSGTGNAYNVIPGRLSYVLGFQGPSLAVDTACSSSLVAIHLACQSLRNRECPMVLAGGVNLLLAPHGSIELARIRAVAPDGRCKTFDARADGFVRGEGCGMVVLKRVSDAQADGDPILGLIRGSAVNNDGRSAGLTAPSVTAQCAVIREALRHAQIAPEQVSYVETHGTGTALGDPIEIEALTEALGQPEHEDRRCVLGAVKTNLGHLEAAAGIAGLIKVLLAMRYEEIPRNLHFNQLNPNINLTGTPFVLPATNQRWPKGAKPRYAGVSSFGWAGTNAHVVVEEAPLPAMLAREVGSEQGKEVARGYLLSLSARSKEALLAMAQAYSTWLAEHADVPVYDICAAASLRRSHHEHRLALIGESHQELRERIQDFLQDGSTTEAAWTGNRGRCVFVCPGQGSQWQGMARALLQQEPIFHEQMQRCSIAMRPYVSWSLLDLLQTEATWLEDCSCVQPALFAIQVSLAALWKSWGVVPDAIVGHSMGEVAAAVISGILSLEEATGIICRRSQLLRRISGQGAMLLVELTFAQAEHLVHSYEKHISIAASNSPNATVLAGDKGILSDISEHLREQGVFWRWVKVEVASHSPQVDVLGKDLLQALQALHPGPAQLPFYSTVTGQRVIGTELNADYWVRNIRETVRFAATMQQLMHDGYTTFIELSPHPLLTTSIRACIDWRTAHTAANGGIQGASPPFVVVSSLQRKHDDRTSLLQGLGRLYEQGMSVEWAHVYSLPYRYVPLPTYPFQRERFWRDMAVATSARTTLPKRGEKIHPLLPIHTESSLHKGTHYWNGQVDILRASYLIDHKVQDVVILPGAVYLEAVIAATQQTYVGRAITLEQIRFQHMLVLPEESGEARAHQLVLSEIEEGKRQRVRFHYNSRAEEDEQSEHWITHCTGFLNLSQDDKSVPWKESLASIKARCPYTCDGEAVYRRLKEQGMGYGPGFQGIEQLWAGEKEVLARVQLPALLQSEINDYWLHPALLDACLHLSLTVLWSDQNSEEADTAALPVFIESMHIYRRPGTQLWSYARVVQENGMETTEQICLLDEEGNVLVDVRGSRVQRLDGRRQGQAVMPLQDWLYGVNWYAKPLPGETEQAAIHSSGSWWIFADGHGLGQELRQLLEAQGKHVVLISHDGMFERRGESVFHLAAGEPADMERLFTALLEDEEHRCQGIIHLWSIDCDLCSDVPATSLTTANLLGCGSVLHLVQRMALTQWSGKAPRLWIVTQGTQPFEIDTGQIALAQAPIWGFGRSIAQEYPELWGGLVDLDLGTLLPEAAQVLWSHIRLPDGEDQVAFRQSQRYVARLETQRLAQRQKPIQWHTDASYLITGGLGGLGLELARWMVQHGARHLILMGRSPLPPRGQWRSIRPEHDRHQVIEAIRELESWGASIHLATVDVADEVQLFNFLSLYKEEGWPVIRGVIHAAGVSHDRLIQDLNVDMLDADFRAKTLGSWLLHQALRDEPLDFFVLFSSAAVVLSPAFLAGYAASNAFLDALAHWRHAHGQVALTINWGFWSRVGMAARRLEEKQAAIPRGMRSFTPEQGLEVLMSLLERDITQVAVMPIDWQEWQQYHSASTTSLYLSHLWNRSQRTPEQPRSVSAEESISYARLRSLPSKEQVSLVSIYLRQQVARILHIARSKLDVQQPLNRMGLDSLMALELKNRIAADLGLTFPVVKLLQGPSIAQLAVQLLDQMHVASIMSSAIPASKDTTDYEEIEL